METTLKGTMRAMHKATGLPLPLFSLSFQASWPISSKFFVLYSSKLVLYMIEGGRVSPPTAQSTTAAAAAAGTTLARPEEK